MNRVAESAATRGDEPFEAGFGLRYLIGVPDELGEATPVVACIHGMTRNVREHFRAFAPLARRAGWLLVTPLFDAEGFPDYQRLGRPGKGARADLRLLDLISHLSARFGLPERSFHLFGHSAGAQFTHRFVMAHPQRVARYAISAPGWYTFPDEALDYPYGIAGLPSDFGRWSPSDFLRVPGMVFVGSADCRDGRHLRRRPALDLHQGAGRLDRASRWIGAMNALAATTGLAAPLRFELLRGGAHGFGGLVRRQRLNARAWAFLTDSAEGDE